MEIEKDIWSSEDGYLRINHFFLFQTYEQGIFIFYFLFIHFTYTLKIQVVSKCKRYRGNSLRKYNMTTVLVIDKSGTIKKTSIKNYDEKDFYKKAGLKTDTDFKHQHTFEIKRNDKVYSISLSCF